MNEIELAAAVDGMTRILDDVWMNLQWLGDERRDLHWARLNIACRGLDVAERERELISEELLRRHPGIASVSVFDEEPGMVDLWLSDEGIHVPIPAETHRRAGVRP